MTAGNFLTFTIIALFLTTAVKIFFVTVLNINSLYLVYVMWVLMALISIACVRRIGVINYLESVLVIVIWLFFGMFLDLLILYSLAGPAIYHHAYLWGGYLVIALTIFLFHKKRHVEIRRLKREAAPPPQH